jgi:O-antigen ligase
MFALDVKRVPVPLLAGGFGITAAAMLVIAGSRLSPLLAGLAICGVAVAVAIMFSPGLGLLLTAAVIPIERLGRFTSDSDAYTVSLMRIIGLLALGSFLLHAVYGKWKFRFGKPLLIYFLYCSFAIMTVFYTTDPLSTVRSGSAIIGNLIFFFLVINVARSWRLAKAALLIWLLSSVLVGIYTMYDWHFGNAVNVQRIGEVQSRFQTVYSDTAEWQELDTLSRAVGPTSAAAVYGINMILTLPFFAFLIRVERDWRIRLGLFLSVLIVMYNIFLSNTRAAILLTIAVAALCVLWRLVTLTGTRIAAVFLILVIVLAAAPGAIYQRVLSPSNYTVGGSSTLRSRFIYWDAAVTIAEKNWLLGVGLGNQTEVPKYLKDYGPETTSAHNEYLQTLDEVGVFGWAVFFSFLAILLVYGHRAAAIYARIREKQEMYWFMVACQIAMISVLLYAFQADVYHFPLKGWWLVAGLTCVMYERAQADRAEANQRAMRVITT